MSFFLAGLFVDLVCLFVAGNLMTARSSKLTAAKEKAEAAAKANLSQAGHPIANEPTTKPTEHCTWH